MSSLLGIVGAVQQVWVLFYCVFHLSEEAQIPREYSSHLFIDTESLAKLRLVLQSYKCNVYTC